MNQTIGVAMYLVMALAVAISVRAIFSKAGSEKELNSVTAHTGSQPAGLSGELRQLNPNPEDVLPWVFPPALAPAENPNHRPPITREEISKMFKKIDLQLSQENRLASR